MVEIRGQIIEDGPLAHQIHVVSSIRQFLILEFGQVLIQEFFDFLVLALLVDEDVATSVISERFFCVVRYRLNYFLSDFLTKVIDIPFLDSVPVIDETSEEGGLVKPNMGGHEVFEGEAVGLLLVLVRDRSQSLPIILFELFDIFIC